MTDREKKVILLQIKLIMYRTLEDSSSLYCVFITLASFRYPRGCYIIIISYYIMWPLLHHQLQEGTFTCLTFLHVALQTETLTKYIVFLWFILTRSLKRTQFLTMRMLKYLDQLVGEKKRRKKKWNKLHSSFLLMTALVHGSLTCF